MVLNGAVCVLRLCHSPCYFAGKSEEKLKLLFVSKTNLIVFLLCSVWIVSTVTVQVGNSALRLTRCFPQLYQCKSGLPLH